MRFVFSAFLAALLPLPAASAADWYKGNTHTHTAEGGGCGSAKTPLQTMVKAYKDRAYNFLVISDHGVLTKVEKKIDGDKFIGINGEELSGEAAFKGKTKKSLNHVTALNLQKQLPSGSWQEEVDGIKAAGAVAILAHPHYAATGASAEDIQNTTGVDHLEIYNTHIGDKPARMEKEPEGDKDVKEPEADKGKGEGAGAEKPKAREKKKIPRVLGEELWTKVLDSGRLMYGVAADDAHSVGKAGKSWTCAYADNLTPAGIAEAFKEGKIYGSTGPRITSYSVDDKEMKVESDGLEIQFVGESGKVLEKVAGKSGAYKFKGDEKYVRAVILGSGSWAFCQPHFPGKSKAWGTGK